MREEIARIIAPEEFQYEPQTPSQFMARARARAKADAILALSRPPEVAVRVDGGASCTNLRSEGLRPFASDSSCQSEWRDIATAPKDGTRLLLANEFGAFDGWWCDHAGGWIDGDENTYGEPLTCLVSHWMPLPAPPGSPKDGTARSLQPIREEQQNPPPKETTGKVEGEGLKPCPFCGGEAKVHIGLHAFTDAIVECVTCSAEGPMQDEDADTGNEKIAKAIAAWNTRATPQPKETRA